LDAARLPVQLILLCGKNEKLAARLRARKWNIGTAVLGFTKEVHKLMRAADFMIGKPGPGSIAEAMQRGLPVLVECNSWTLPQERFNTEWVKEKKVGVVLKSFEEVVGGVKEMLEPAKLAEFKKNAAAQNNSAIVEIMEILDRALSNEESRLFTKKVAVSLAQ
jgi:1,2-diacylglycerol 3-beta-galactosyltransferase